MSLPTASKPSQLSIRSFFQAQQPNPTQPQPQPPSSSSSSSSSSPSPSSAPRSAIRPPPTSHSAPPQIPAQHDPPAPAFAPIPIPPEAAIRPIRPADVPPLRRLNALLLPVSYNDAFYQRAADPSAGRFSRLITWSHAHSDPAAVPTVVGAIVCRVEPELPPSTTSPSPSPSSSSSPASPPQTLYIQSLCLLAPYRSMGLAAAALDAVAAAAAADPSLAVRSVTAHVWAQNDDALRWYDARGFRRNLDGPIRGYYLKLRPDSAWLVSRPLGPSALLRAANTCTTTSAATTTANSTAPGTPSSRSYQSQRPDTEWNDLPDDMAPGMLAPGTRRRAAGGTASEATSSASSRSSSAVRKKRDRAYPVAAFGNS